MPSAAIRAQQSDYITISNNKVYDNTFWTTQGVGAITISEATVRPTGDTYSGTKIVITQNEVYRNENRLISWNPNKTFVHFVIDEGAGIFLTRNKNTYNHGEMLIANNLSYKNGASGIVCHHTNRATIEHNTVFDNATTNHGNPGGIGVNASDDVKILSNISYSKSNKWALGILAEPVTNLVLDSNIVFNNSGSVNVIKSTASNSLTSGWNEINPLFTDENNFDFSLSNSSAAINNASSQSGQTIDYFGVARDANPDIGAIEYSMTLGIENQLTPSISIYPNPVKDILKVKGLTFFKSDIKIVNTIGQEFLNFNVIENDSINLSHLPNGLYIVKIKTITSIVYKQ